MIKCILFLILAQLITLYMSIMYCILDNHFQSQWHSCCSKAQGRCIICIIDKLLFLLIFCLVETVEVHCTQLQILCDSSLFTSELITATQEKPRWVPATCRSRSLSISLHIWHYVAFSIDCVPSVPILTSLIQNSQESPSLIHKF